MLSPQDMGGLLYSSVAHPEKLCGRIKQHTIEPLINSPLHGAARAARWASPGIRSAEVVIYLDPRSLRHEAGGFGKLRRLPLIYSISEVGDRDMREQTRYERQFRAHSYIHATFHSRRTYFIKKGTNTGIPEGGIFCYFRCYALILLNLLGNQV